MFVIDDFKARSEKSYHCTLNWASNSWLWTSTKKRALKKPNFQAKKLFESVKEEFDAAKNKEAEFKFRHSINTTQQKELKKQLKRVCRNRLLLRWAVYTVNHV